MNMKAKETSTDTTIKKLTQKIDALLVAKYNSARESFTSIRSVMELLNPTTSLMYQLYRQPALCRNCVYTRVY